MDRIIQGAGRWGCAAVLPALGLIAGWAPGQEDAGPPPIPDTTAKAPTAFQISKYDNLYQGQFTPGQGFDIIRTTRGSLNIRVYGVFRYVNQLPADQKYLDHLGREKVVKTRQD